MAESPTMPDKRLPGALPPNALQLIFASACEALGSAFLVWLLGGIALSIAGSVAEDMVPSPPPFLPKPGGPPANLADWRGSMQKNAFVIIFLVFFAHSL